MIFKGTRFDPKSRNDIPKLLRGLQHLYMEPDLRASVFELLNRQIAPTINKSNGRPGMTLWTILVCGIIRLDLNIDYRTACMSWSTTTTPFARCAVAVLLRMCATTTRPSRTCVSLLTPELLDEINQLVVKSGHALMTNANGKKKTHSPCVGAAIPSALKPTSTSPPPPSWCHPVAKGRGRTQTRSAAGMQA